jgi:hypothetical protein
VLNQGPLRNGPGLRKKMAENFVLQRFRENFNKNTTKYDLKTFNGREQNLNRLLIINLLLVATRTNGMQNTIGSVLLQEET